MRVVSLVFLLWFPCFGVAIIDENSAAVVDELKKVIAAKAKIDLPNKDTTTSEAALKQAIASEPKIATPKKDSATSEAALKQAIASKPKIATPKKATTISEELKAELDSLNENISFDFYTLKHNEEPEKTHIKFKGIPEKSQIQGIILNHGIPTKILIPGFLSTDFTKKMSKAYQDVCQGSPVNLIIIEWIELAKKYEKLRFLGLWQQYKSCVNNVKFIGEYIGAFLIAILDKWRTTLKPEHIQMVTFSLGVHLGVYSVRTLGNIKIGSYLAIDPAGPKFREKTGADDIPDILNMNDADFVAAIHTCMDVFGNKSKGINVHANFLVGGGNLTSDKLALSKILPVQRVKAHEQAYSVYAVGAIRDPKAFKAYRCAGIEQAKANTGCNKESERFMTGDKPLDWESNRDKYREGRIYFVPKIEDQDADLALAYGGVARAYVGKKQARNDSDDEHLAYG